MSYQPRHAKPSRLRKRFGAVVAGGTAAAALLSTPVTASAQEVPGLGSSGPDFSAVANSSLPEEFTAQIDQIFTQAREQAWQTREDLHQQAAALSPELQAPARQAVDNVVEAVFPGLIAQKEAERAEAARAAAAAADAAAAEQARAQQARETAASPCPASARACVDIAGNRTWLQENGRVTYGPVVMSSGAPNPTDATPKGTHYVSRKVKDEISYEFNNAPMPYAVYFTSTGVAFHEGDPYVLSNGCIHLHHDDAVSYFDQLQIGDEVFVY